ncbi:3-keto-5-aminohexanoate cleavage protein [uncultured Draconibacterium sp.]|uniref:3-keto-5-aminohexanoate cleavage protein n=1 Tax=uncultured Draconibacterium sp. TaxID=1573823 RepID=UPI002AA61C6A|nr:3-keto-5-aminohexanoate cleavage protein [uncultured Draconibacterium sp.]
MEKIIVNFCPTGMIPNKKDTPYIPVSASEIIEQVHEAYELGITIAHLHARDKNEVPTYRKGVYQTIFEGVRKNCPDLVICGSTSGRNFPEFEKRSEVIELKPDMCSLTLSSLNFPKQASLNAPEMIGRLIAKMKEYGVSPELECFDLGMINYGKYLLKKQMMEGRQYWNLIFGNIAGMQSVESHFQLALDDLPANHYVGFGGIGKFQLSTIEWAIENGVGVRVGLEDNIWWDRKNNELASNMQLIKYVHTVIEKTGKKLMPAKEFGNDGFYNSKRD